MFVLEVLTKCLMLFVIGVVSINDYGSQYRHDYSSVSRLWNDSEFLLAVLFFSVLFDKISELWSLDGASNDICLILGMFLTILALSVGNNLVSRVALALQAIPEALGLLRYLSVNQSLRQLVIMVGK